MKYVIFRGKYEDWEPIGVAHSELEAVVLAANLRALFDSNDFWHEAVGELDELPTCNVCGMVCGTDAGLSIHRTTMRHAWTRSDNLAHQFWIALERKESVSFKPATVLLSGMYRFCE